MDATSAARLPLESERGMQLQALVLDMDPSTLTWVSGYIAGLAAERARSGAYAGAALPATPLHAREAPAAALAALPSGQPVPRALVLYASQTGNGRRVADRLGRSLEAAGVHATVVSASEYPMRQLADERLAYFVASTHGDGEPPDDARPLFDFLAGRRAPRLERLAYTVLALGDSSYPRFCATGRALDERLAELGARRLAPRIDSDVDVEAKAGPWLEQAVASARAETGAAAPRLSVVTPLRPAASQAATREHPVEVELLVNQRITARGADRDVRHLELALPEQRFEYEAGDSLGIWVENSASAIERTLEMARLDPAVAVTIDGTTHSLRTWLTQHREVTRLARPLLVELAARSGSDELRTWLEPSGAAQLRATFKELQVADLLMRFPAEWDPEGLVRALHPLAPRLYSIASSRREVRDEAHLTVAVIDNERDGVRRRGAASWQLANQVPGSRPRAYVEPNPRFRLPS